MRFPRTFTDPTVFTSVGWKSGLAGSAAFVSAFAGFTLSALGGTTDGDVAGTGWAATKAAIRRFILGRVLLGRGPAIRRCRFCRASCFGPRKPGRPHRPG